MKEITYATLCSGIEAATVSADGLGWRLDWLSEIEPFPCDLLSHKYSASRPMNLPDSYAKKRYKGPINGSVTNIGDLLTAAKAVRDGLLSSPDVLLAGTPCTTFSMAGDRQGLDDPRGMLTLAYPEILDAIDENRLSRGLPPTITVWENVHSVLSDKGNAFGKLLGLLSGTGVELFPPGQRWPSSGCVLRGKRQVAWRTVDAQFWGVPQSRRRVYLVASAREGFDCVGALSEPECLPGNPAPGGPGKPGRAERLAAVYSGQGRFGCLVAGYARCWNDASQHADKIIPTPDGPRRLTVEECERLMGFPVGYTDIPGYEKTYGPKYKALGNSWAIPCSMAIIRKIDSQLREGDNVKH